MDDFAYDVFEPKQRRPDGSSAALMNASMRPYPSRDVGAVATMFDPSLSTSTHSSNGMMYHQMDVPSMQAFHGTSLPPPPLNHPSQYSYGLMSQRDTESMGWSSQNTSQPNAYHNGHILHDASQFPATHNHAMYQSGPSLNSTPSNSYSSLPQTSMGPPAPSLTTLDTSSVSGDHKKEKRKSQVRDASRRRRAKRKDEETRLRERIHELTQQIQIMGNPTANTASGQISQDLVSSSSAADALDEAYKQQLQVVQALQEKNQQYKAKLAQHDHFARLLQSGIQHLSDPHLNAAPMILPAMPSTTTSSALTASLPSSMTGLPRRRSLPALLASRSDDWMTKWSHQAMEYLLQTVQPSSQTTTMPPPACTNVAMGWTLELWLKKPEPKHQFGEQQALGDWIEVKSCKDLNTPNALDAMAKTTDILTTLTKGRRVFPELKALEVLKHVSNDISIVSRTDSQGRRQSLPAVDLVSVVVQVPASGVVGIVSFEANGDGTQPIEMACWSFGNDNDGKSTVQYTWRAKQDNDHVVAATSAIQLANETIFTLVRWESEAVSPVFRVLG